MTDKQILDNARKEIDFLKDLKDSINSGMSKNDLKTLINQRMRLLQPKEEKEAPPPPIDRVLKQGGHVVPPEAWDPYD